VEFFVPNLPNFQETREVCAEIQERLYAKSDYRKAYSHETHSSSPNFCKEFPGRISYKLSKSFIIDTRAQKGGPERQKDVISIQGLLPSPRKERPNTCHM